MKVNRELDAKIMAMPGTILHNARPRRDYLMAKLPATGISEAAFQEQVIDLAHELGWRVAHFRRVRVLRKDGTFYHQTPVAADGAGFPDLLLTRLERIAVIELKVGRNKPTDEQLAWLAAFNVAGVPNKVFRPDDWPQIVEFLA